MKRIFLILFLVFPAFFWACDGGKKGQDKQEEETTATPEVPVLGTDSTGSDLARRPEDVDMEGDFIVLNLGGAETKFTYAPPRTASQESFYRYNADLSYGLLRIQRYISEDKQERFYLQLHHAFPHTYTEFPATLEDEKSVLKASYYIKEDGTKKAFHSGKDLKVIITKYEDGLIEGQFSGTFTYNRKDNVRIENGAFRANLKVDVTGNAEATKPAQPAS